MTRQNNHAAAGAPTLSRLDDGLLADRTFFRECIDHLRWLAAVMVMIGHVRNGTWVAYGQIEQSNIALDAFYFISNFHFESVVVFFVLSGLLIGGRGLVQVRTGTFNWRRYAIDRFSRIAPPFYSAVVFSTVVYFAVDWLLEEVRYASMPISAWQFAGHGLFIQNVVVPVFQNNVSLWSLTNETWYYICFGLIAVALMRRSIALLVPVVLITVVFIVIDNFEKSHVVIYAFMWVSGIAVWIRSRPTVPLVAGLAALTAPMLISRFHVLDDLTMFWLRDGLIAIGMVVFLWSLSDLDARRPVKPNAFFVGSRRMGAYLANMSYSLYLIHMPILWLMREVAATAYGTSFPLHPGTSGAWGFLIGSIVVSLAVSWMFYYLVERNTARIRAFIYRMFGLRSTG